MSRLPITKMDRRHGRDAIALRCGPHLRGWLLRLSNDRWAMFDVNERRVGGKLDYLQPAMARDKFDELFPNGVPA